jgi:hypothetical protein
MPLLQGLLTFSAAVLLWLGLAYGIHRLAHWSVPWNALHRWHAHHHSPQYFRRPQRFRWHHLLLCFASPQETFDIWVTLTLPALLVCLIWPAQGALLLAFHYAY